jgi:hypothetical protein
LRSVSVIVAPVALQPGRSGNKAQNRASGSLQMKAMNGCIRLPRAVDQDMRYAKTTPTRALPERSTVFAGRMANDGRANH